MNKLARAAFERADRLDPTLTLDGLNEFLPAEPDSEVDQLAVTTLHEFFADERLELPAMNVSNETGGTPIPTGEGEEMGSGDFEGYFTALETAPELSADDRIGAAEDKFGEAVEVAAEDPGPQSEIQRAALDFQRFAEKFHAFASQCQRRRAAL